MKHQRTLLLALAITLIATPAFASLDGIWWNPNIPGEGWNCSSQADTLFCLQYGYEGSTLQPTYRSIIATLNYTILSNGDIRVTAVGDVYRTQAFTDTVRTGAFQGTYEAGVFRTNASGLQQTLIPFDFAYGGPLEAVQGFFLTSTIPIAGLGTSQLHLTGTVIRQTTEGLRYKEVFSSNTTGLNDPNTIIEFPSAIVLYRGRLPFPPQVDVFIWPVVPYGLDVLFGVEAAKTKFGFNCLLEVATGQCLTFGPDVTFVSLANSERETITYTNYVGGFQTMERPAESEGVADFHLGIPNIAQLMEQRLRTRADLQPD